MVEVLVDVLVSTVSVTQIGILLFFSHSSVQLFIFGLFIIIHYVIVMFTKSLLDCNIYEYCTLCIYLCLLVLYGHCTVYRSFYWILINICWKFWNKWNFYHETCWAIIITTRPLIDFNLHHFVLDRNLSDGSFLGKTVIERFSIQIFTRSELIQLITIRNFHRDCNCEAGYWTVRRAASEVNK